MESVKKTAGKNLKEICKLKHIRNIQIADYMGVTESGVSHWFKGDNFLDIDNLYKLCQFLGVSLDQVFGLKPIEVEILDDDEKEVILAYRKLRTLEEKNIIRSSLRLPERKKDMSSKAE